MALFVALEAERYQTSDPERGCSDRVKWLPPLVPVQAGAVRAEVWDRQVCSKKHEELAGFKVESEHLARRSSRTTIVHLRIHPGSDLPYPMVVNVDDQRPSFSDRHLLCFFLRLHVSRWNSYDEAAIVCSHFRMKSKGPVSLKIAGKKYVRLCPGPRKELPAFYDFTEP
jgi:hypothetical protein